MEETDDIEPPLPPSRSSSPARSSRPRRPLPRTRSRLGAVLPVTGKESKIGGAFKAATEFAVKEVNDAGGLDVGGKKMKVELCASSTTRRRRASSAQLVEQLMAQQKVHAVIGGYGSQLVQAQSVVPDRYGIPYVSGGAGATSIYGRSKWVFGVLSPVENLASTQMDFLSDLVAQGKLKKPLKIALLMENTEHGKDFQKGVKDYAKAHPEDSPSSSTRASSSTRPTSSRSSAVSRRAKADLFMCDAHLEDFISMQRAYTQMGLYHQMVTYGARGADEAGAKDSAPRRTRSSRAAGGRTSCPIRR